MKYKLFLFMAYMAFASTTKSQITTRTSVSPNLTAGDTVAVVVQINKQDVQGFGRLMQTLPSGLVVTKVDCGDGEYKTQGNLLNIAWLRMPTDPTIIIKYYLATNDKDSSDFRITGDFTWVQTGKRGSTIIDPIAFKLKARKNKRVNIRPTIIFPETGDTVKAERELVDIDGKKRIKILLKINKSGYNGSAEIRESIPKGYKLVFQSKTIGFRAEADTAYFSWPKISSDPFVSEMYLLVPTGEKTEKVLTIGGRLIFRDKTKSISIIGYANAPKKTDEKVKSVNINKQPVIDDSKIRNAPSEDIFRVLGQDKTPRK